MEWVLSSYSGQENKYPTQPYFCIMICAVEQRETKLAKPWKLHAFLFPTTFWKLTARYNSNLFLDLNTDLTGAHD